MSNNITISNHLIKIFSENWNENFLYDALNNTSYTYNEIFNEILKHINWFKSLKLENRDIVCLLMNNSFELLLLYFSSLIFQLKVVPIDPVKGKKEIFEIFSQIKYKLIITNNIECNFLEKVIQIPDIVKNDEKVNVNINDLKIFNNIDFNKEFLITFTSGSTGVPKGVVHSFSNLFKSALAFAKRFKFNKNHIFYHNLPMTYMAGILNQIFLPFLSGSRIVLGDRFNISSIMRYWEHPIKYNVNVFWFIPTIVSLLVKLDRGSKGIDYAKKTRIIGCCGTAPLSSKIKGEFEKKYQIKLFESYGLSETLFVSTNYPGKDQINCVGPLLEGVELKFLKDNEILIKTPWNLLKYANFDVNLSLIDNYFSSGDIGVLDTNHLLHITDRKKDLIIRGGINISPKKIQDFLSKYNIFEEFVIFGVEEQILGEITLLVYVPNQNFTEEDKKNLNLDLIDQLGQDYQIDEFFKLDTIPKNINGKIDKIAIKKFYNEKKK